MKQILQTLFYGKHIPYEDIAPKNNPEYIAINAKINKEKNYFKNVLSEDNYARLEKLEALYTESSTIEIESAYIAGFSLAVKIMVEVYEDNENINDINVVFRVEK